MIFTELLSYQHTGNRLLLFLKSGCIAAATAESFRCVPGGEALIDGFGPWGIKDCSQILIKEIAKWYVAIVVQAAGDNRSVAKNADMVTHSVAEYLVTADLRI